MTGRTLWSRARAAVRLSFAAAPIATSGLVALAVLDGVLPVAAAWSLKVLLDELATGPAAAAGTVTAATTALVLTGLLLGLKQSVHTYADGVVQRAVRLAVQERLFRRVNAYPGLERLENPAFLDRLRLAEQAGERAPEELIGSALATLRGLLSAGGFIAVLLLVWPPIALVLVAAAVPAVALHLSLGRRRIAVFEGLSPLMRRRIFFHTLLVDARAAKELRLFGLGEFLHGRMLSEIRSAHAAETALGRRELRTEGTLELVTALVTAIGTVAAAYQAMHGRLTVGDVSVFIAAVAGVHIAISGVASAVATVYEGLSLFGHYQDLVEEPPARPAGPARSAPGRGDIELRDVWFRYRDDLPWVLRGVDLVLPRGMTVGLVGLNGAGKSTIVKLLTRMYEPTRGSLRWGGVDIRDLPLDDLRARIGAVFQDFMTYDLTAAENIGLGRLDLIDDLAAIRKAASAAGVDQAVAELPGGYRTLLSRTFLSDGEASSLLSAGQWQRIAVARALLRADADLMILDEPSAGLDPEAEHEVHERLQALRAGRTSLLISHRLSALRDADLIYVLDGGVVTESGCHDALMAANGCYARLFRLQAAGYQTASSRL